MWFLCVARHLFLLFKKNRLSIEEKREWDRERGGGGENSHNKNSCKFNSFTIFTVGIRITTRWLNRKGTVVVSRYTESLPQACFFLFCCFWYLLNSISYLLETEKRTLANHFKHSCDDFYCILSVSAH